MAIIRVGQNPEGALSMSAPRQNGFASLFDFNLSIVDSAEIYELVQAGRIDEAREIYRWFRPLLDLDVSTYLVQQIKLAEAIELGSTEHVRMPRQPLKGAHRQRVEKIVRDAIATRPDLSQY